ncbi:MAG: hypothetical protein ABFR89_02385 [Actinomycetota bacterium]
MKVNNTFEFDDQLRFGVAMVEHGELRMATREECRAWLETVTAMPMVNLRKKVEEVKASFTKSDPTPPLESAGQSRTDA